MTLSEELSSLNSIFIDTAPIIYYIEAHPKFGPLTKDVVKSFQSGSLRALTSVISMAEVLVKPFQDNNEELAEKFAEFLEKGKNIELVEINSEIAKRAGKFWGRYSGLRLMDAIQISASIETGVDAFLTNDKKLKQIKELKILVLDDYLRAK